MTEEYRKDENTIEINVGGPFSKSARMPGHSEGKLEPGNSNGDSDTERVPLPIKLGGRPFLFRKRKKGC